jgi:hypothetical protein
MAEAVAQNSPETLKQAWWQGDTFFIVALITVTLAIAYGMARYEVVSRAKKAYLEGEKYYDWYHNPDHKKAFFDAELAAKRIDQDTYTRLMEDSDIKNAYVWYDTVTDLFQPPRSEWVIKSEDRLKEVKPLRDAWLKSMGIDPVD